MFFCIHQKQSTLHYINTVLRVGNEIQIRNQGNHIHQVAQRNVLLVSICMKLTHEGEWWNEDASQDVGDTRTSCIELFMTTFFSFSIRKNKQNIRVYRNHCID